MATAPTTERKPNPNALKPKQNYLVIGGVLVALGGVWFVWEGWLRPRTEEEIKNAKEEIEMAKEHALEEAKEAARHPH